MLWVDRVVSVVLDLGLLTMKTIYTTLGTYPFRVALDEEKELLINKAIEHVRRLKSEANWFPSLDIPIFHVNLGEEKGEDDFLVKVGWNREKNEFHSDDLRVNLGYESHDGFMSAINSKDLRNLPEVYFERTFIKGFSDPRCLNGDRVWTLLREEDQPQAVKLVERDVVDRLINQSYERELRFDWYNNLLTLCRDIQDGQAVYKDLVNICEEYLWDTSGVRGERAG